VLRIGQGILFFSDLGWSELFPKNDEFRHTWFLLDQPALADRRGDGWRCRNCRYVRMVSADK
jgi:hypothetical protein